MPSPRPFRAVPASVALLALTVMTGLVTGPAAHADGVADRQTAYLNNYYNAFRNHSTLGTDADTTINVALTAFALNKPQADIDAANAALNQYFTGKGNYWDGKKGDPATIDGYWASRTIASVLMDPNLNQHLTADNRAKMKAYLFSFVENRDNVQKSSVDADLRGRIYESGNHDMHSRMVYWSTAQILKDDPAYKDRVVTGGQTVEQRYGAWTTNLLDYFQDRAGKGGTVEVDSTVYAATYHSPVFNIAEYAEDERLKDISRQYLTLHMADLAQKTTEGISGGAKSRAGKNRVQTANEHRSIQYLHLFTGEPDGSSVGDGVIPGGAQLGRILGGATLTDYRLPQEVVDMVTDEDARGTYTYTTNRMGEGNRITVSGIEGNVSIPSAGQSNLLHTTRVTPEFTLGWFTTDENRGYLPISGQSQAFFAITDASPNSRLVMNLTGGKVDDELQGVGDGDAMMFRRQINRKNGQTPRVYVSDDFTYSTDASGWVFGTDDSGSFFAIKGVLPANGSTVSHTIEDVGDDGGPGNYLTYSNDDAVVIVQMGQASKYADLDAFKADIIDNALTFNNGAVTYDPGAAGGALTMFNSRTLPKVNGQNVDLTPAKTYDSPYLNGDYGATLITLTGMNGSSIDLDFDYNPVAAEMTESFGGDHTQRGATSPGYRELVGVSRVQHDTPGTPFTYSLATDSVLQIDFDGFHNAMDQLIVDGTLELGGEFLINMIRDTPTMAGVFQVLEADRITGSFDTITLPSAGAGLTWDTDRLGIDGTIALLQSPTLTYRDTDDTTYGGGSDPDDNPPVDAAFRADLQAASSSWSFKGLDEGGNNDVRAMTFYFEQQNPALLESVTITARVQGTSGFSNNEGMRLDTATDTRRLSDMQGWDATGSWMTLIYELTPEEFALLADGQLNLAFADDVVVDWVTLSWVAVPEPTTSAIFVLGSVLMIRRR